MNGCLIDEFCFDKGLSRGDPLSPFLFLNFVEGLNVMMRSIVEAWWGQGHSAQISHLQFAHDTLLLGEKSWANVRALKVVLNLFEVILGSKANFHKSILVEVNVPDSWFTEASLVLSCEIGRTPFMYLDLLIGCDL